LGAFGSMSPWAPLEPRRHPEQLCGRLKGRAPWTPRAAKFLQGAVPPPMARRSVCCTPRSCRRQHAPEHAHLSGSAGVRQPIALRSAGRASAPRRAGARPAAQREHGWPCKPGAHVRQVLGGRRPASVELLPAKNHELHCLPKCPRPLAGTCEFSAVSKIFMMSSRRARSSLQPIR